MDLPATTALPVALRDLAALGKPRVVALLVLTALVGMMLAAPRFPDPLVVLAATLGIALAASAAAAANHVLDARADALMRRTRSRPIPAGRVRPRQALAYAALLAALSMILLGGAVNALTAWLTALSLVGYSVVYTVWLKRATPQNIVLGGAAGAMPPLLGWAAVAGQVDAPALVLFLIVFLWTPPHFWPLAIERRDEYAAAGIPMLPVVRGVRRTRLAVLGYTLLLVPATLLPWAIGMSGPLYLAAALALGAGFLYHAAALNLRPQAHRPMRVFRFSIVYLALLFAALLVDHYAL